MDVKRQKVKIGGLPEPESSNLKIGLSETQNRILKQILFFLLCIGIMIWILHGNSQFVSKDTSQKSWSNSIAVLSVDELVKHDLVKEEDSERAVTIISTEILDRLSMGDFPPSENKD